MMTTTKPARSVRPPLTSLTDSLARKPSAPLPVSIAATPPAPAAKEGKDERVQLMVRVTPAERKALRRIALDQDTTVQALIEAAARDLIRRHEGK